MSFERTIQMDNSIILPVFGQFDANIKKIEKECRVSIVNRGDDVKISGEEMQVHQAWNILHSLAALARKGEEITEQNLEYFIASAAESDLRELEKVYDDLICITVNGRPLKPKTLGQKKYV
ncbi:MAG: phosphate starvation-inducible protein PhoH, partial [Bacillota bacterium]|nr:phosphate starvation-inducible protein PhoH [Bacillota bacterium]